MRSESTPGVHFRGPGILGNVAWGRRARGARGRGFPRGHVTSHARTRWSLSPILSDFVRPTSRRRERRASFECMTHVAEFGTIARAWCFSNVDQAFFWVLCGCRAAAATCAAVLTAGFLLRDPYETSSRERPVPRRRGRRVVPVPARSHPRLELSPGPRRILLPLPLLRRLGLQHRRGLLGRHASVCPRFARRRQRRRSSARGLDRGGRSRPSGAVDPAAILFVCVDIIPRGRGRRVFAPQRSLRFFPGGPQLVNDAVPVRTFCSPAPSSRTPGCIRRG